MCPSGTLRHPRLHPPSALLRWRIESDHCLPASGGETLSGQQLNRQEAAVKREEARRDRHQAEIERAAAESERGLAAWRPDPGKPIERAKALHKKAVARWKPSWPPRKKPPASLRS
jgi:hypothetical protein